jgi:hypothetical protein
MKKLILIFIFLTSINLNAQCDLSLDTILKSYNLNDSDFETYFLSRGYEYIPEVKKMVCLDENYNVVNLIQKSFSNNTIINYNTFSKSNYIQLKTDVVNLDFKYVRKEETEKSTSYFYSKGNVLIILNTDFSSPDRVAYSLALGLIQ